MKLSNFSLFALMILSVLLVNSAYQSLKSDKAAQPAALTQITEPDGKAMKTAMAEGEYLEEDVEVSDDGKKMSVGVEDIEEDDDDEDEDED